jgi:aarF domain-containing kinase
MEKRGIKPGSPESILFGRKLLRALTDVFARSILESGFFHADPHPGNIFVLKDGSIGLIDFGQVKQISGRAKNTLAKVMVALDDRESDTNPPDLDKIGKLALELGVELRDDAKPEGPAAVAMWLFDGSVKSLPGGYANGELDPNSPVKELKSFPQDLVLVGRSTVLLKGLSSRLGIPWSLSHEWAPTARAVLENKVGGGGGNTRFRDIVAVAKKWVKGKLERGGARLPKRIRTPLAKAVIKFRRF